MIAVYHSLASGEKMACHLLAYMCRVIVLKYVSRDLRNNMDGDCEAPGDFAAATCEMMVVCLPPIGFWG